MRVDVKDIEDIFPRPLDPDEIRRAENLLKIGGELIEEEFLRRKRDLFDELHENRLLMLTYRRVLREMVSEAVHIGENVGRASATSTTGPQSDSVTWSQGIGIHWGGVHLTEKQLKDLGLTSMSGTRGSFGTVIPYAGWSRW